MNVTALLEAYQVDQLHARQVADLSLALFDAVAGRYALPADYRRLLEIGGLLHNVGLTTDPPAHHLVGRDIVLRHVITDLSLRERALVACMVAFHRKKVRPQLEPAYLSLGKKGQSQALQLAAILRVADGLDYHQSQTTSLITVEPTEGGLLLRLTGPHAEEDGARAVAKADLWAKVFGENLRTTTAAPAQNDNSMRLDRVQDNGHLPQPPANAEEPEGPQATVPSDEEHTSPSLAPWYAAPETPLAELGRVLLRRHLRRLLAAEREVRADKEIEAVHALRVATRRLRATLRLLAPVYTSADLRTHSKAIARIARIASAVRDRDVLLDDLAARAPDLPDKAGSSLEALMAGLRTERQVAYTDLIAYLDSNSHAGFLKTFAAAMNDCAGWNDTPRVRDLGGSTLWRHYEILRAHDRGGLPENPEELHQMRIEGKRMRYVLELFADTLGPQADEVVQPLMAFQDHLGVLNDIEVARHLLAPHGRSEASEPAVTAYLALREQQGSSLHAELPARWERLNGHEYRRQLMELIVAL